MASASLAWNMVVWGAATVLALGYVRGWRAWRRAAIVDLPGALATRWRLTALVLALVVAAGALAWPLDMLSQRSIFARMGQTVALCLIAAPLFWLACPFHVLTRGLAPGARRGVVRGIVRPNRLTPALRFLTSPPVAWFLYLCAVLSWHDPGFVDVTMARPAWHRFAAVILFGAALLFWQVITLCGPRLYAHADLAARLAMIVAIEIANVIAGISIAFRSDPIYAFYAAQGDVAAMVVQQSLAGALTWVFGSIVYITSAVLVINQIFRRQGIDRPERPPGWDADERFIAPGLEGRLREVTHVEHDWRDY